MSNKGATPIDPNTPVGSLRYIVGDTEGVPFSPAQPGFLDYSVWSDDALTVALLTAGGNMLRAAGGLYRQLAAVYMQTARSIKTDDLALNTTSRGKDLLEAAQSFFDEAQANDNAEASDFFQIVPFGGRSGRPQRIRPEGTPMPLPIQPTPPASPGLDGGSP